MTLGYLVIEKNGNDGAYSIHQGFNFTLHLSGENKIQMLNHLLINHNFL
tara:strand:+ start:1345 stop:1491 length:147 start_codon:yes stop_codon:yes gene_type:complete